MAAPDATPDGPIRVVYADDSFLMREALGAVLERLDGVEVVAGCVDGDALLAAVDEQRPDVVVTDMRMPPSGDEEGIRVAHRLRQRHPGIGVVVLTQYAEPRYGLELLAAGPEGRGYLLKERVNDPRELHAAIEAVAHGGSVFDPAIVRLLVSGGSAGAGALDELTPRERQVLAQMAQGKSNAAIAEPPRPDQEGGREARRLDLPEARAAGGACREPAGGGRAAVSRRRASVAPRPRRWGVHPAPWRAHSIVRRGRPVRGSAHACGRPTFGPWCPCSRSTIMPKRSAVEDAARWSPAHVRNHDRERPSQDERAASGPAERTVLKTKFAVPRGPITMVPRRRLLHSLDAGVQGPLTLLAAPAGAGKTALLSSWIAAGRAPGPVAWLSLDGDDADRRRFWRAVLATLSHATGDARMTALAVSPREPMDMDLVLPALVDALDARDEPVVLVLDDLHQVADVVREDLERLVRYPPPALRLVLVTRSDPPIGLGPAATRRLVDGDPRARSGVHARRGRCAVRRARRVHRARRGRDAVAAHRGLVGRAVPGRHVGPRPPRAERGSSSTSRAPTPR